MQKMPISKDFPSNARSPIWRHAPKNNLQKHSKGAKLVSIFRIRQARSKVPKVGSGPRNITPPYRPGWKYYDSKYVSYYASSPQFTSRPIPVTIRSEISLNFSKPSGGLESPESALGWGTGGSGPKNITPP